MIYKRCYEKGCAEGKKPYPRCNHAWHYHGEHTFADGRKVVQRGPMKKWAHLLAPGQELPRNRSEAESFAHTIHSWLVKGAEPPPPPTPPDSPPTTDDPPKLTLIREVGADFLKRRLGLNDKGTLTKSNDNNEPGCTNRIIDVLGHRPIEDLCDLRLLEGYLDEIHEDKESWASRNRAFSRLSTLFNYSRQYFGLVGPSPIPQPDLPAGVGEGARGVAPAR